MEQIAKGKAVITKLEPLGIPTSTSDGEQWTNENKAEVFRKEKK